MSVYYSTTFLLGGRLSLAQVPLYLRGGPFLGNSILTRDSFLSPVFPFSFQCLSVCDTADTSFQYIHIVNTRASSVFTVHFFCDWPSFLLFSIKSINLSLCIILILFYDILP
uniref:Uncharacterized protein n=1 Tax=Capillidium heterosporum TaxID=1167838 RepID=A0A451F221_9FUNG|nr:hypothetical protein [Capillidium heterosporum]AZZ06714.1 hypothetical protein [Capillidium heterosporum]